jgi:hypothetical protein
MMLSGMSRSLVRACMVIFAVLSVFTGVALHGVTDVVIGRAAPPFRVLNPHAADSVAVSVPGCVARHLAQPHAAGSVAVSVFERDAPHRSCYSVHLEIGGVGGIISDTLPQPGE